MKFMTTETALGSLRQQSGLWMAIGRFLYDEVRNLGTRHDTRRSDVSFGSRSPGYAQNSELDGYDEKIVLGRGGQGDRLRP
jgi:hypothetical protein